MLFNSYGFIFVFLPIVLLLFFWAGRLGHVYAILVLALGSVVFYLSAGLQHAFLLAGSIGWNMAFATLIVRSAREGRRDLAKAFAWVAVLGDLAVLGWCKYAAFLGGLISGDLPETLPLPPPGISFFTFTQIAFVIDLYRTRQARIEPLRYVLFVTYFPHLIAGPLFHHAEMMQQFSDRRISRFDTRGFSVGLSIFAIGLFKKLVVADSLAPYAAGLFDMPHGAGGPSLLAAWGGTLAYSFQIYFDFSAYSDMAVGLSKMLNIKLPINFFSPYKATSLIDFWRRWHITLSRFLRDYLYIPLGGSRRGRPRQYFNLLVTMLLGGLWHGAALTFVVWGLIHGLALLANYAWRAWSPLRMPRLIGWALTFSTVAIAWVFFRAPSFSVAVDVLSGLAGLNGVPTSADMMARLAQSVILPDVLYLSLPDGWRRHAKETLGLIFLPVALVTDSRMQLVVLLTAASICFFLPNTQQLMRRFDAFIVPEGYGHDMSSTIVFRLTPFWAFAIALMAIIALTHMHSPSPFLYFQF